MSLEDRREAELGKITQDRKIREIILEIADKSENIDFSLMRDMIDLEESKLGLGRRKGITTELRNIVNKYLDERR